jgi:phage terminase small subunit
MTQKQKRFAEEYLIDLNATQAAIRAGYSVQSAGSIGEENLRKPEIDSTIKRVMAERSKRVGISADRVLTELAKIGFANISDVADFDDATVRNAAMRDDTAAIQSIKVKRIPMEDGEIIERELKLHDKVKSLELLGRHLGVFNDKLRLEGGIQLFFSGEEDIVD